MKVSLDTLVPTITGLAKIAKISFDGNDMRPLWQQLTARFDVTEPTTSDLLDMSAAWMDMAVIDQLCNDPSRGLTWQAQALGACRLYQIPATTTPPKLRVLGFMTAGKINANIPIEFMVENSDVTLYLLYIVPGLPLPPLPDHDVAMVLAAEAEAARPVLQELERLTAQWPHPVLNLPARIPILGRERLSPALADIPGVDIPATSRLGRAAFARWEEFPVIVRPLDSHAGDGLEKVADASARDAYLHTHPEAEFHVSRFVDYRSPDGQYRKYRVAMIDGEPYPVHMAISDHWMIHYLNAGMTESAAKRAEEAQFMNNFRTGFGKRHGAALARIASALGLEYFGIDCGETQGGELLIFEASTALVVHDMDPPALFPYKHQHMQAAFEAFRAMLYRTR